MAYDDFTDLLTPTARQKLLRLGQGSSGGTALDSSAPAAVAQSSASPWAPTPSYVPRTVNYADVIGSDPGFRQLQVDLAAQGVSGLAGLQAAIRRGVIEFGEAPLYSGADLSFAGPHYASAIDDATRALAAQNTQAGLSTVARIAEANRKNIRLIKNTLAARGALRSGELGHLLRQEDVDLTRARADATQRLLDYLGGINAAFAQNEHARQLQLAQAMSAAAGRAAASGGGGSAEPAPAPAPASPAVPPPNPAPPVWHDPVPNRQGVGDVYHLGGGVWAA